MTVKLVSAPMPEREKHLAHVLASERFLAMQGLGNEVPFFICPYPPSDGIEMEHVRQRLVNNLQKQGIAVLTIDLYDLSVQLLQERGVWDRLQQVELTTDKSDLLETLQTLLDPQNKIAPAVRERIEAQPHDMVFLTGIGEVFPYIRSHNVLNNLQSVATATPLVMFFPGEYRHTESGSSSLELFGVLHDDQYYRAFNIFDYAI